MVSFDIWIYHGNYQHNQDNEQIHQLLGTFAILHPVPDPVSGHRWCDFPHHGLVLFSIILFKWNHSLSLYFLAYFTQYHYCTTHPHCRTYQYPFLFWGAVFCSRASLLCLSIPSLMDILTLLDKATKDIQIHASVWPWAFFP